MVRTYSSAEQSTDQAQTTHSMSSVRLVAQGTELVCEQTPAGSWICCADDGAPRCARGFTPDIAAANWERSQALAE